MDIWGKCCGAILKLFGWTIDSDAVPAEKCVILGVPHTSILDFAVSYLYYRSLGEHAKCMIKKEFFFLALSPEGTRKPVKNWKTGFHLIASKTGIPVYMGYFNWGTKHIGRGERVELTDDARADMKRIQALYEEMHLVGRHPEKYITH